MNNLVHRIFGQVNRAYLIKYYLIGLFIMSAISNPKFPNIILAVADFVLFPFSGMFWDDIKNYFHVGEGNFGFFLSWVVYIIIVVVKYFILFAFAIILGSIEVIKLYRKAKKYDDAAQGNFANNDTQNISSNNTDGFGANTNSTSTKCLKCGNDVNPNSNFCTHCGAKLK